ncbi:MAG: hypothetical protein F4Y31_11465 [Gammaproteobacteria bacterium]|nr:hypothetical protein [Gammaproteobacteria bacterium]MYF66513.1 hypothetical protein [Gammaproteobacteria bacterium]MYK37175.1 hypothetical protein [Gammaproteobacteria bacterium]
MDRKRRDSPRIGDQDIENWGPLQDAELLRGLQELIEAEQNAGYPPLEAVPDDDAKGWQELSDCEDFATELELEFGVPLCNIEKNPEQALPDCFGKIDGQRVGIEVTRLTITPEEIAWQRDCRLSNIDGLCLEIERDDPARARKIRSALTAKPFKFAKALKHIAPFEQVRIEPPRPAWLFDYFQKRLRAAIREKEEIAANRAEEGRLDEIEKLFLLIRTNEYNLPEERVGKYLQRVEIPALQHFDDAYLILPARAMDGPGRHSCPVFRIPA